MTIQDLIGDADYKNFKAFDEDGRITARYSDAVACEYDDNRTQAPARLVKFDRLSANLYQPDNYDARPRDYIFKKINETGYNRYLQYLKGRNTVYLVQARQELNNGTV